MKSSIYFYEKHAFKINIWWDRLYFCYNDLTILTSFAQSEYFSILVNLFCWTVVVLLIFLTDISQVPNGFKFDEILRSIGGDCGVKNRHSKSSSNPEKMKKISLVTF